MWKMIAPKRSSTGILRESESERERERECVRARVCVRECVFAQEHQESRPGCRCSSSHIGQSRPPKTAQEEPKRRSTGGLDCLIRDCLICDCLVCDCLICDCLVCEQSRPPNRFSRGGAPTSYVTVLRLGLGLG
jgi:hypothetical protein